MIPLAIFISFGIPMILLHTRKNKWNTFGVKLFLGIIMLIVTLIGLPLSQNREQHFLFFSFLSTPFYLLLDYWFKMMSIKIHDRDFYLYIRNSSERTRFKNGRASESHIQISDKVFSFLLLLSTITPALVYLWVNGPILE